MKLSGVVTLAAPRPKVWEALQNPEVLAKCIPGCEKLDKSGDEFVITQNVGIAAVKGRYTGKLALRDLEPPTQCVLHMEGKGPGGFMRGSAKVKLVEKGEATELAYDADVQIGGLLASLGSRLVEPVAKQLVGQFFQTLERQIQPLNR